ncbi:FAD:protein FMN transferase [Kribbella sp. CA-293567]|uniref:FAD:protein FMN transferase n=1 Tax=Kribbella sp. CA-293567 TaxID=3002436 RepID=UPI0022DCF50A|nr:FAD:protein FMN transferase [Kribbella sp. CA-293567]WBQ03455.1 FAD:protein FMN transferase [Kribbella sp. CA-293567]
MATRTDIAWRFDAIGVPWRIDTATPLSAPAKDEVQALVDRFDATYSRFRAGSLVTTVSTEAGGRFEFPSDAAGIFDLYDQLHRLTDGAVDPLVGRQLERLGYDAAYSLTPRIGEGAEMGVWSRDVRREGRIVSTRKPVLIDVGAVGKGYLVDQVSRLLTTLGVGTHIVDAGGDLRHRGAETTRVGLEHPTVPGNVIGTAEVHNQALCASAVTRRAWRGLHHVLDARTGVPTRDIVATWVVAPTAAEADGLATALFFVDPGALAESFDYTFVRVRADHVVEASPRWRGDLFADEPYLHLIDHQKGATR